MKHMTLQKALKIIDWWINQKNQATEQLEKEWDFTSDSHGLGKTLLGMEKTVITNLKTIQKELIPNCKHPKKMRDRTSDGQ